MSYKKLLTLLAVPLLLLLSGCSDEQHEEWHQLEIDNSLISVQSNGGEFYLSVDASHQWDSRIQYSNSNSSGWISLNPSYSDSIGYRNSTITIRVSQNDGAIRSAKIILFLRKFGIEREIQIVQEGNGSGGGSTQISAPTNLRASASGTTITLNWNSVPNALYYNVYYMNGSWSSLGNTENTSCSITAEDSGTYYFAVTAIDSKGNESSYSNTASCTVIGGSGGDTTSKPSAPTGLSAYWDGPAAYPYVILSWSSVSNADNYLVYRSTSANGSYSQIGNSSYSSYSDNNVSIGKTYYYKVKASNSKGTSDYSSYTSVTLSDTRKPGPVKYGNCTATGTSITLRWTLPTDASYGKPTKIVLRLYDPTYKTWVDAQELSGTATQVTFNFGMWIDADGYVKCGVIPYNDYGSGGGSAKIYDTKSKKWLN